MPNGKPAFQLSLPQWDDAVHIVPENLMDPAERGRRRLRRRRAIEQSPQPDIASAAQEFLAAYDDIQDAFVTLAVIARLGVRFYPPAERIARWLAGGADILNAGQSLQTIMSLSKAEKRKAARRFSQLPNTYRRRLLEAVRTRKFGVRATELLQAAQTTDTLFGVGVSLGGIMALPVQGASLAVTGGDFRINPFPADPRSTAEFLGPWQHSIRLRSNPPLRAQVDAARAEVLPRRNQEINYLLNEISSALGRPISLEEAATARPRELLPAPERFTRRLQKLYDLGDSISPQDLDAELQRDVTITMLPVLGIPAIAEHFFPPPTGFDAVERIRANSATLRPQLLDPGTYSAYIAAAAGEIDPAVLNQLLFVPAAAALRAAARVMNKWKIIAPAKDDLTDQEHLDMLAALNLAWAVAGPIFSVFDYTATEIPTDRLELERTTYTQALNTWGSRITDSPMREVAQQLLASTVQLQMSHLEEPWIQIEETLPPLAAATVRLLEVGAVGKSGRPLGGSRIDPKDLPHILAQEIYSGLTHDERQLLQASFSPGAPTAAPPEISHPAGFGTEPPQP